ncbi:hypothetical protein A1O7_06763 [Cladophialophora yegresii CBS 114405]|uniref:Uncharacterized protein n=1 Tax=Cladophialophora yegresii CBS 114405 TaxID=1182544 RepID=W9VTT1_9EURO|nr:uncharacterized protein A1O7_06763 [Cladophialophora yegresii CBS 114405]EXJ56420.1 hypothetical protein A1O7_06763 [Cladophialophora yegresii CBS 114405]
MLVLGHALIIPLLEQLPIPFIQSGIIRAIPRDEESRQTTTLPGYRHAGSFTRCIDPAVLTEDSVAVCNGDVVREALEEIQIGLVKYTIFGTV